jgi:probable rRNA maturation factor
MSRGPGGEGRHRLALSVQYADKPADAPSRALIRKWVQAALARDAEIGVRLVPEAEGRELNARYRGKDYATNVLTFDYHDDFLPPGAPLRGDLVLCAPVVGREAAAQGKAVQAHYAHLVVHGVLHLQGYDHEAEAEARVMEARESEIVMGLGYPAPYLGDE